MYRYGRFCSVVGMAGTDDCNGETVCAIGCHQHFFRFYLVTGILPIGIDQRGAFGYAVIGQWLLVGRGTADKDILPRFILEQADITLHVFCRIADESMTWNQIYQTIADALGKPLNALHVASDFLAKHSDHYDFRGELLGDKAATVVFDNSKIKRLVPDFICNTSMADGLRQAVHYMLSHPESQIPDPEFDSWCDRIANAISAADKAFELS